MIKWWSNPWKYWSYSLANMVYDFLVSRRLNRRSGYWKLEIEWRDASDSSCLPNKVLVFMQDWGVISLFSISLCFVIISFLFFLSLLAESSWYSWILGIYPLWLCLLKERSKVRTWRSEPICVSHLQLLHYTTN